VSRDGSPGLKAPSRKLYRSSLPSSSAEASSGRPMRVSALLEEGIGSTASRTWQSVLLMQRIWVVPRKAKAFRPIQGRRAFLIYTRQIMLEHLPRTNWQNYEEIICRSGGLSDGRILERRN